MAKISKKRADFSCFFFFAATLTEVVDSLTNKALNIICIGNRMSAIKDLHYE